MDLRLAIPAVCAWLGAAVVVGLPSVPVAVPLALWGLAIAVLVTRRRTLVVVGVSCAAVALVCSVAGIRSGERHPPVLSEAASASRHVTATVEVTQTVVRGATYFDATATRVTIGRSSYRVSTPVLVFTDVDRRLAIGETVAVGATLREADPGEDVAYLVFADDAVRVLGPPSPLLAASDTLRHRFAETAAALPGDGGALLPGLAIGDTTSVSPELSTAMKSSSLSHLTAVSGANCAVVVGLAMLAGRALGLRRRWRIAVSVAVLVAFVLLVTPEPSVLRAAAMALLVLVAALGGRVVRGVPLLAAAALGLVVYDPWLSRNYGFVLSVLATAALMVLAEPLARLLQRWLPPALSLVIAVPLSAQLACQPVLLLLNPTVPLYGVLANLLAEPAAPVATVAGLAACALLPLAPALGTPLAWVAWAPAAWIAAVARFFSGLAGNAVPWVSGPVGVALLALATVIIIVAVLVDQRRVRMVAAFLVVLLVVGMGAATVSSRVTAQLARPTNWQIAGCDVGQGDAFLVRSAGHVAMIDTGPEPAKAKVCLDELGIRHLDLLVLTHYDLDHVGGSTAVEGKVDRVLVGPVSDEHDERLRDDFAAAGATVVPATRGMTGTLGTLTWQVLWPRARLDGVEPGNAASITMYFSCGSGCLTSLFLGDLGQDAQNLLMAAGPLPHVDVVKVAHHGSRDQEPRLYAVVHATVGAIGVGLDNDYGHPTKELLNTLAAVGTRPVRTDLDGMYLLSPGARPGDVRVWTEHDGGGG
jgi:competence protein ComEC